MNSKQPEGTQSTQHNKREQKYNHKGQCHNKKKKAGKSDQPIASNSDNPDFTRLQATRRRDDEHQGGSICPHCA